MIRRVSYFVLGLIAMALGGVLFLIAADQFIKYRLYGRLPMMLFFGWVVYLGFRGVQVARKDSN